jgi:hypothetical protein
MSFLRLKSCLGLIMAVLAPALMMNEAVAFESRTVTGFGAPPQATRLVPSQRFIRNQERIAAIETRARRLIVQPHHARPYRDQRWHNREAYGSGAWGPRHVSLGGWYRGGSYWDGRSVYNTESAYHPPAYYNVPGIRPSPVGQPVTYIVHSGRRSAVVSHKYHERKPKVIKFRPSARNDQPEGPKVVHVHAPRG